MIGLSGKWFEIIKHVVRVRFLTDTYEKIQLEEDNSFCVSYKYFDED